jgi:hypothetical protein
VDLNIEPKPLRGNVVELMILNCDHRRQNLNGNRYRDFTKYCVLKKYTTKPSLRNDVTCSLLLNMLFDNAIFPFGKLAHLEPQSILSYKSQSNTGMSILQNGIPRAFSRH